MHIHLDPVGGLAGDMFIAAVLDAFPELQAGLLEAIRAAAPEAGLEVMVLEHGDGILAGKRFEVMERPSRNDAPHPHSSYRSIRQRLTDAAIAVPVKNHAIAILDLLANAEARVHGIAVDDVGFHELGEWDSIADVIGAGFLLAALAASWSIGPLPLGRGRVKTAHGQLPVPAPATVNLLEGFECIDDGIPGERVTPTGAAIVCRAGATATASSSVRRLRTSGIGFGARRLPGLSNILRVMVFDAVDSATMIDRVAEISFEVDDQSPEDLAIGLDRVRDHPAVRDVLQAPAFGKKGRLVIQVRVLAEPDCVEDVVRACLGETTTLGVRHRVVDRVIVPRRLERVRRGSEEVKVKVAQRESGWTLKVEADDLVQISGHREREQVRREVEAHWWKREPTK